MTGTPAKKAPAKKPAAKKAPTKAASSRSNERPGVAALKNLDRTHVLIIGGGINGISSFRDLASQGVDVTLIERGDFASGASSASSHMIHGGIRYLENGEFRLVKEAVQERNDLIKTAPQYVKPLRTTIPIFTTFSGILSAPMRFLTHKSGKPKERGAALITVGLTIYDSFGRDGGAVPRSKMFGRKKSLKMLPKLNPDVKYTATYFDASMHDPERLALAVLLDGLKTGPHARAVNYVEAVGRTAEGVVVRDNVTGDEFTIKSDVVVNTSGPWTDLTNKALGNDTKFMGGTKGSHIVLDNPELVAACRGREIFFEHDDGRIVLIYPLKGRAMVGTTDIPADPSQPTRCTEEEVDYFFDLVDHVFPTIPVSREQIVYKFSGIRPLPRTEDAAPGFISRDYRIEVDNSHSVPLVSLVGGKWTTFRAEGEAMSDKVLGLLGKTRKVSTKGSIITGGEGYPNTPKARAKWLAANLPEFTPERAEALLERYGTRAIDVKQYIAAHGDDSPVADGALSTDELAYQVENEQVVHLIDVLLRRTSIAFVGDATLEVVQEIADALAPILGWTKTQRDAEVRATRDILVEEHGLDLPPVK